MKMIRSCSYLRWIIQVALTCISGGHLDPERHNNHVNVWNDINYKFHTFTSLLKEAIFPVLAQQNPSISYITKEVYVNIGDTVDLHCSVHYAANYPILWVKINQDNPGQNLIISSSSTQIVPDQRYSIRHDEASSTYTLQITKIQETDTGRYQCQVQIASLSKLTDDAWIHVRIPPIILDNSTQSVATTSGAAVSLSCYATGFPQPKISWRRENNDILPTGGAVYRGNILTIHNITKHDRGTYYCIADNGVGKGARRHVGVEVEFAPVVSLPKEHYGQAVDHYVDLYCQVEAFPEPSILWLKDRHQIFDNQHNHHISSITSASGFTETRLRIRSVDREDYGEYTCKAINKLGHDQKKVTLYETLQVQCPPSCGLFSGSSPVLAPVVLLCVMFCAVFTSLEIRC